MKKLACFLLIIVLVIGGTACDEKSVATNDVSYDIESDIEFVKNIFACGNAEFLTEALGEDIMLADIAIIKSDFAGIDGRYEVTFYGENDDGFEPNNIYTVKFVWDSEETVQIEAVAAEMCKSLGDFESNYDKEWGYYCWHGSEKTRFSDAESANSFDVQTFGNDCYISFGIYTIS